MQEGLETKYTTQIMPWLRIIQGSVQNSQFEQLGPNPPKIISVYVLVVSPVFPTILKGEPITTKGVPVPTLIIFFMGRCNKALTAVMK